MARNALSSLENSTQQVSKVRLADAESVLAFVLIRRGEYREAETLLQRAFSVLASRGREDRYTRRALDHLIALYEAWDRPEQAELYRDIRDGSSELEASPEVPELGSTEVVTFGLSLY